LGQREILADQKEKYSLSAAMCPAGNNVTLNRGSRLPISPALSPAAPTRPRASFRNGGERHSIAEWPLVESEQFAALVPSHDLGEGLAARIERRRPNYRGS